MKLVTEAIDENTRALLYPSTLHEFSEGLISTLKKYSISVEITHNFKETIHTYEYVFIILNSINELPKNAFDARKILVITHHVDVFKKCIELVKDSSIKVINIDPSSTNNETYEKILWFLTSNSAEKHLNIARSLPQNVEKKPRNKERKKFVLTKKKIVLLSLYIFLLVQLFFIIPLSVAGYYLYSAGKSLQDQQMEKALNYVNTGKSYLAVAKLAYIPAQPVYNFFFLARTPENIISIEENVALFISTAIEVQKQVNRLTGQILSKMTNQSDVDTTENQIYAIQKNISILSNTSQLIADQLNNKLAPFQKVKKTFEEAHTQLSTASVLSKHLKQLLGGDHEKKYVVYFYNNMELRPGGGFIGSFAILKFDKYRLKEFTVYDVYDADGQLTIHVEPPAPIRKYLNQPHLFLRDSNFNPDFIQNVKTGEYFLEKELGFTGFDGSVGITTTALSYIISAFGSVYIPDLNEYIDSRNFYSFMQDSSEKDFFAGSTQKKSQLSLVARTLFLKLQLADPAKLGKSVLTSLSEKHIVFNFKDENIQKDISNLHWDGRVVIPRCVNLSGDCINNHFLPIDANVGVNKVNFYVYRVLKMFTKITKDGNINNELQISYTNSSLASSQYGGTYSNYFQVYIPGDSTVDSVKVNGLDLDEYSVKNVSSFKVVGFFFEVKPQMTMDISVGYTLDTSVQKGANSLQFVVQKQIGAANSEFSLELVYPDNIFITNKNFASVEKKGQVLYNSNLSTDKIFVIDLVRQ